MDNKKDKKPKKKWTIRLLQWYVKHLIINSIMIFFLVILSLGNPVFLFLGLILMFILTFTESSDNDF